MPDSPTPFDPSLPSRPPISRGTWAFGCAAAFALIVLLAALSIWLYFRGRNQRALRDVRGELARIQAAGEPITTEEMIQFHRVPEGTLDATPLWIDAIQTAVSIKDPSEPQLPLLGTGNVAQLRADAPQSLLAPAEKFLAAHGPTIDKTRQAAAAGTECRYPIDFSKGISATLPHIQEARRLARILSLRLHVAAANEDAAAAIESLKLELALAQTMDHEPLLIVQLVRMAVLGVALNDVRVLVSDLPLTDAELADLQRLVAGIDVQRPIKEGMIGERAMGFHTFHNLSQMHGMELLAGEDGELQRPGDLRVFLELLREMIEAADLPPAEARMAAQRTEQKLFALVAKDNVLEKLETVVTTQLVPATGKVFDASARAQAARDSAVCGIAFRRYQLAHGSPPDSLAALVPEFLPAVPLDPFAPAGTPLILLNDGNQFAIYSVGLDGRDDRALLGNPESNEDDGFVAKLAVAGKDDPSAAPDGGKE